MGVDKEREAKSYSDRERKLGERGEKRELGELDSGVNFACPNRPNSRGYSDKNHSLTPLTLNPFPRNIQSLQFPFPY